MLIANLNPGSLYKLKKELPLFVIGTTKFSNIVIPIKETFLLLKIEDHSWTYRRLIYKEYKLFVLYKNKTGHFYISGPSSRPSLINVEPIMYVV